MRFLVFTIFQKINKKDRTKTKDKGKKVLSDKKNKESRDNTKTKDKTISNLIQIQGQTKISTIDITGC